MQLTLDEMNRYSQQLKLDSIGIEGQLKLKQVKVLCIGAGGLGSSLLLYLAASGIGTIGIVDDDVIELSNLHRQVLYQTSFVGQKKAIAAKAHLTALNPNVKVYAYPERMNLKNANDLISQYDIVADCSDNFATRYLINDLCFYLNKPYIFASISQFQGQCSLFLGAPHPCLRCLFPFDTVINVIPNCSEGGVLGVLPGLLGIIQATEIIKWILKLGNNLSGHLLTVNIQTMQFRQFQLTQDPACLLCVSKQPVELLNLSDACSNVKDALSVPELQKILKMREDVLLIDVRSLEERQAFNLGGIWIPLPELLNRLSELNPTQSIIIYCQSGQRSIQAMHLLRKANFSQLKYLHGGVNEWKKTSEG